MSKRAIEYTAFFQNTPHKYNIKCRYLKVKKEKIAQMLKNVPKIPSDKSEGIYCLLYSFVTLGHLADALGKLGVGKAE